MYCTLSCQILSDSFNICVMSNNENLSDLF